MSKKQAISLLDMATEDIVTVQKDQSTNSWAEVHLDAALNLISKAIEEL